MAVSEADRLAALRRTGLLDTPPEPEFDAILRLAAEALGVPMAAIHLVDADRQFGKAEIGLGTRHIPRGVAFCPHAMLEPDGLVVPDAAEDPRFASNPLVTGAPGIRFYAGMPLLAEGLPVGALCVLDTVPRAAGLTERERAALRTLAAQVSREIALRRALAQREALLEERTRLASHHRQVIDSATDFAILSTDLEGRVTGWNLGAETILGWTEAEMRGRTAECVFTPEDRAAGRMRAEMALALDTGRGEEERWCLRRSGERFWASCLMTPLRDEAGAVRGFVKVLRDRTEQHRAAASLAEADARLQRAQAAGRVGVFSVGIADGLLAPTPEFCRLYGVPMRDAIPAGVFEALVVAEDRALVSTVAGRRLGEAVRDVEYRIRRADDGEVRRIARTGDFEYDAEGRPVRFVGVVRDVTETRAAQRRIAESEARYRTLIDNIDVGFCVVAMRFDAAMRAVDYRIDEANAAFERQTGADVVGRWVSEFAPDLERHWFDTYGRVALTGEPVHFENHAEVFDRWFDVRALRVGDPAARRVAIFFTDITGRKTVERARQASDAQFRALAQTVPNQIWTSRPDGHLDWFNDQVYAYTGADRGLLDGPSAWSAFVHPDDLPAAAEAWARALAAGTVLATEFRLRRGDGAYRWFLVRAEPVRDEAGQVTRWVGANTDIEESRRQAAALAALNASLEQKVEERTRDRDRMWRLSTDIMLVADFTARITAVNPAWTTLLGWTEAELVGTDFTALVHPDDVAATRAEAGRLAEGITTLRFENRYRHRDGGYRWISWTGVPDAHFIHAVGRDIQGEKEAEEALRRSEEQLRQSQKMEAVGHLTGGIAHDFNNLLTGITGSLELLRARVAQGRVGEVGRYIGAAQGAAQRAAALTHRLLAFSRRQTLDPRVVDVNRLIGGMEELVRRTVGPSIAVEVVGAGGLWAARVDPNQLENALLNLCINARDAMPGGGRITIETANRWLDARAARERDLPAGAYLSLCVTDTGTGMSPEVVARAFDPFFTTKPIGQGTGLGLSMIYGFVRQSGGQVRIHTEPGQGTTMCLYLPRHLGEAAEAGEAPSPGRAPRAERGETVLVVDDEPTVRMLVTEVLEELGYTAIEAGDGPEGLSVLRSGARVDLLVTDVGLPGGMNGRQLADAARVARPALKVLFITGYAENAAVGDGHLEPGMHVLTKPFALDALATRIRDLITQA